MRKARLTEYLNIAVLKSVKAGRTLRISVTWALFRKAAFTTGTLKKFTEIKPVYLPLYVRINHMGFSLSREQTPKPGQWESIRLFRMD